MYDPFAPSRRDRKSAGLIEHVVDDQIRILRNQIQLELIKPRHALLACESCNAERILGKPLAPKGIPDLVRHTPPFGTPATAANQTANRHARFDPLVSHAAGPNSGTM